MTPEQEQKLNDVYGFMQAMKANATIPYDVSQALRERLRDMQLSINTSSKAANSEDITVDTGGGTGSTDVLDDPDRFIRLTDANGTSYDVPAWNV